MKTKYKEIEDLIQAKKEIIQNYDKLIDEAEEELKKQCEKEKQES